MAASTIRCPNMNHGKLNPSVSFCPSCGKKLNSQTATKNQCDHEKHKARRKDRNLFCFDCGTELSKI
jgi:hypothetical protein